MKKLEDRILKEGAVLPGNILKVDSFLNHQIDTKLYEDIAAEFVRLFKGTRITKILTIEASGIGLACFVANKLSIPALFAKKHRTTNLAGNLLRARVSSYTTKTDYSIVVCSSFLSRDDRVLIIDDFLAHGNAALGLIDLVNQAGATLVGCGFVIEKGFQEGGKLLREKGIRVESLAIVDAMTEDGSVIFRKQYRK